MNNYLTLKIRTLDDEISIQLIEKIDDKRNILHRLEYNNKSTKK